MTTTESLTATAANPHVSARVRGVAARLARDLARGAVTEDWAGRMLLTTICVESGVSQ